MQRQSAALSPRPSGRQSAAVLWGVGAGRHASDGALCGGGDVGGVAPGGDGGGGGQSVASPCNGAILCKASSKVRVLLSTLRHAEICMSSLHKLSKGLSEPPPVETPEVSPFEPLNARTTALVVIALGVTIFLLRYM